jgi:metallo-beta-lactamase family protein
MAGSSSAPMHLSFLGAARSVTGSRFMLEANGARVLVDCGLAQERDLQSKNWEPFPVAPDRLDAVLLTHAHLDHCGLLPRLVREGFRGSIFATAPTAEIARIVMLDSARLQREDVEQKKRRHEKEQRSGPRPLVPLYDEKDAEAAASLFKIVAYDAPTRVADGIEAEYLEAGHILGSASIRVAVGQGSGARTILFSGDIGRWDRPILNDPAPRGPADYVLIESTYGDSLHGNEQQIETSLQSIIMAAVHAGGNIIIPSFAIERSQEVLYYLSALLNADRIPQLLVFLDSPMATKVTDVFRHYPEYFDQEMRDLIRTNRSPFDLRGLVMARRVEDSKAINRISGSVIVVAGAGMCNGGRIKHHLVHNLGRRESTILFVGYQAEGTLGRQILDGARTVRIFGQMLKVNARVARIPGFSAHADRDELVRWASCLQRPPRQAFVIHGEPAVADRFSTTLKERLGWNAMVPAPGQLVELQ